jgi:hypothetical protein
MAKMLKTYQTSLGFFDLAVAAPSMKAALQAWGADRNLFQDGVAKQSDDPDIIAAAMAAPGVVLKRPVGSKAAFGTHSKLPAGLARPNRKEPTRRQKRASDEIDKPAADLKATLAAKREQARRAKESARQGAARQKEQERQQRARHDARRALDKARRNHDKATAHIKGQLEALEKDLKAEEARWQEERAQLEGALEKASRQDLDPA